MTFLGFFKGEIDIFREEEKGKMKDVT